MNTQSSTKLLEIVSIFKGGEDPPAAAHKFPIVRTINAVTTRTLTSGTTEVSV